MKTFLLATSALVAFAASAQAADLGVPRSPVAAAVLAPAFNWTGFYVGAHVGYATGTSSWRFTPPGTERNTRPAGVFGGVQLGYNWQINQAVLGLEADIGLGGVSNTRFCPNPAFTCGTRVDFLSTIRARAGFAMDRALLYVTGGLAIDQFRHRTSVAATGALWGSYNVTRVGLAVGAGVEYAVAQNWTVKAEYLYHTFGSSTQAAGVGALDQISATRIRSDLHTFKLGVNYLFSTGPSAVVARY
ncbi:outer membrane protein [Phreatobacter sp.]|uniref:outer membrane protein n=1 Tax=Phreatobacter sp. TaxID=1966341 RepID=UPI0022BB6FA0|nr:outer membrane protein [Phreatobacter sp.]MCZ8316453.1 porin family protein [Phreatobacter sp.]